MTVDEARELLGEEARGLTDSQIQSDIEVAELLKDIFFDFVIRKRDIVKTL